jgi:hypothetical protein
MKAFRFFSVLIVLAATAFAGDGAKPSAASPSQAPGSATTAGLLPTQFSGWQLSGSPQTSKDPGLADPANAALLKEYGFTDFQSGTYTRDDGRKLTLKAARFADASGAYGAFTYYKLPQMLKETIPDQAASLNERVLFYRGNILVDVVFEKLSAMSAAELRELSQALPSPTGNTRNLPSLPAYLPKLGYVRNTAKYVVGPIGLEKISSPVPAQLVDFGVGSEVALGTYQTSDGLATLILVSYPTPQIAAEHLRLLDAAHQTNSQQPGSATAQNASSPSAASPNVASPNTTAPNAPVLNIGPVFDKRTGPMLVIATGTISADDAKALLSLVNYEADITWNENTYTGKKNNLGNLLLNVFMLCAILMAFSAVAGLAFGGIRIFFNRILPESLLHRNKEVEFISLNLAEGQVNESDSNVSSSIKAG